MALPSPGVIELAKAYAHFLERFPEASAAEAFAYIADPKRFPGTPGERRSAQYQAQKAMEIGERLTNMDVNDTIGSVYREQRKPARTVGVRVRVKVSGARRGAEIKDDYYTLYVEALWSDTLASVYDRAVQWAEEQVAKYGTGGGIEVEAYGPTLWPDYTPGLGREG